MTDNENKPMLLGNSLHYDRKPIRDDQGRQKGTDETYTLRTEQPLSQVKGDLSVCILQTEWKKVKITDADINKEFTLDGIPFELLSFKKRSHSHCSLITSIMTKYVINGNTSE